MTPLSSSLKAAPSQLVISVDLNSKLIYRIAEFGRSICHRRTDGSILSHYTTEDDRRNIDRRLCPSDNQPNLLRRGLHKIGPRELQRTRSADVQGTRNELINEIK